MSIKCQRTKHLRIIHRQRQTVRLDPDSKLPDHLKHIDLGDNFMLHEEKTLLIFTTDANLSVLETYKNWFADGTFQVRL
jgi:hypothetical protein